MIVQTCYKGVIVHFTHTHLTAETTDTSLPHEHEDLRNVWLLGAEVTEFSFIIMAYVTCSDRLATL